MIQFDERCPKCGRHFHVRGFARRPVCRECRRQERKGAKLFRQKRKGSNACR